VRPGRAAGFVYRSHGRRRQRAIFERTRDELRHGRSVGRRHRAGIPACLPAIRDTTSSTEIVCVILASSARTSSRLPITLGIGVASASSAPVLITQSLLGVMLRWRSGETPASTRRSTPSTTTSHRTGRFDIVRNPQLVLPGLARHHHPRHVAIIGWGFRLGIDLRGRRPRSSGVMNPGDVGAAGEHRQQGRARAAADGQSFGKNKSGYDVYLIQTLPTARSRPSTTRGRAYDFQPGQESVNTVGQNHRQQRGEARRPAGARLVADDRLLPGLTFGKQRQVTAGVRRVHLLQAAPRHLRSPGSGDPRSFHLAGSVDNYFITAVLTGVGLSFTTPSWCSTGSGEPPGRAALHLRPDRQPLDGADHGALAQHLADRRPFRAARPRALRWGVDSGLRAGPS